MPRDSGVIYMGVDSRNHPSAHGLLSGWITTEWTAKRHTTRILEVLEDIRDVFQRIRLARVPYPSAGSTHVSAPETCRPYDAVPRTLHPGTFPSYTSTYPVRRRQQSTLALHHGFRISDTHLLLGLRVDRSEDGRGRRRGGRVRARGPLSHARRKGCSREFLLPGEGGEVSARAARWCTAPRC